MVAQVARYGVVGRAVERGLVELVTWNPRDYAEDRHATVDDRPYGGGPGMVMKVAPLQAAIRAARAAEDGRVPSLVGWGGRARGLVVAGDRPRDGWEAAVSTGTVQIGPTLTLALAFQGLAAAHQREQGQPGQRGSFLVVHDPPR